MINNSLKYLLMDEDPRLPIQFYKKCKDPAFEIEQEVLEKLKEKYSALMENSTIREAAKFKVREETVAAEFEKLLPNQNSPRP